MKARQDSLWLVLPQKKHSRSSLRFQERSAPAIDTLQVTTEDLLDRSEATCVQVTQKAVEQDSWMHREDVATLGNLGVAAFDIVWHSAFASPMKSEMLDSFRDMRHKSQAVQSPE